MGLCCRNACFRAVKQATSITVLHSIQGHNHCAVNTAVMCRSSIYRCHHYTTPICSIAGLKTCAVPSHGSSIMTQCLHQPFRQYASDTKNKYKKIKPQQESTKQSQVPEVHPPGKLKTYMLKQYVAYMQWMERGLERKYPKAYKIYMLVKLGIKDFFLDLKMYYKVVTELWNNKPMTEFKRIELECYRQVPTDMFRVAPVLLISALPFMNYVIFPIAYLFPRHLLCRHFWTREQRLDFGHYYLAQRIHHQRNILHYLDKHTTDIPDEQTKVLFQEIIQKLRSGSHPTIEEIVQVRHIFDHRPFGINYLSKMHKIHTWHLAKSMNLSTGKEKLTQSALLLHHIDLAMAREGIQHLATAELQQACFVRGLNARDLSREEMIEYLKLWASLSKQVDGEESSITLMLHGPVLLAYNRATNKLLRTKKSSSV